MKNLILLSLGFIVIYNLLFFDTNSGIGTGLFFLFLNSFYFLIKRKESIHLKLAMILSTISVFFAFLVGWRSNEITTTLNIFVAVFFSLCALYFYKQKNIFSFEIPKFILIPLTTSARSIYSAVSLIASGKSSQNKENNKLSSSLIRGLIITIPIFAILLILLTHADPVFSKLVERLLENIWQRILFSTVLFIGLISFGLTKIEETVLKIESSINEIATKAYELLIIAGSLVALFAIFMGVQFRYFFSNIGERELHQLGVTSLTYSEYVRKGFFELLAASVVATLVIVYIMKYLHKLKDAHKLWVQIISSVLTLEIGLLLISAAQRINLYQAAHGLTRARIFGFIFLIWLAVALAIILVRVFREIARERLFKLSLIYTLVILFLINLYDIDGLIAAKYRPSVNGEIDYYYLTGLSPDAVDSWKDALLDSKRTIENLAAVNNFSTEDFRKFYWAQNAVERLNSQINYLYDKYGDYQRFSESYKNNDEKFKKKELKRVNKLRKWQSFNLGEYNAYQVILENKTVFDQIGILLIKANDLDNRVSDEVRYSSPLDRSTQPPLI